MKHLFTLLLIIALSYASAQIWEQDNSVFNPSGIPGYHFAQPRFCDFDQDGIWDFWYGNSSRSPVFIKNNGTATAPLFRSGFDYAASIEAQHAEVAVSVDLNGDGLMDLVTGGFTGLHLYINQGTATEPVWVEDSSCFNGLVVGNYPVMDLADVDADGDLDLVVGFSEDGSVKVYFNTGTASQASFNPAESITLGDIGLYAFPIFVDYNGDGLMDVLCGRDGQGFVFYENTGTATSPAWQENSGYFENLGMGTYWNSPTMADLNGDGKLDLLYGTVFGHLKLYYNTGTATEPNWQENTSVFGGMLNTGGASNPVFYDWDSDGDYDLICGQNMGYIKFYRNVGDAYTPAWQEENIFGNLRHTLYSAVTVGDLDGDGLPDIIIGVFTGALHFHRNTGDGFEELAGYLPVDTIGGWAAPRLIDMDQDGLLDLVVGLEDGTLRYYHNIGTTTMPSWEEQPNFFGSLDAGAHCVPTFGDWNRTGTYDLMICGFISGNLKAYRRDIGWTEDTELVAGLSVSQNATPALIDLDHDGDLDLLVGNYDGTFSFYRNTTYSAENLAPPTELVFADSMLTWQEPLDPSSPFEHYLVYLNGELLGETTETAWTLAELPLGNHLAEVKAQYIAGTSTAASLEIEILSNDNIVQTPLALNVYPNPFAGQEIHFDLSLKQPGKTHLEIFNIRGQKLRSIYNGILPAGNRQLSWDGTDAQGKQLPKGIYLCRITIDDRSMVKKIVKR